MQSGRKQRPDSPVWRIEVLSVRVPRVIGRLQCRRRQPVDDRCLWYCRFRAMVRIDQWAAAYTATGHPPDAPTPWRDLPRRRRRRRIRSRRPRHRCPVPRQYRRRRGRKDARHRPAAGAAPRLFSALRPPLKGDGHGHYRLQGGTNPPRGGNGGSPRVRGIVNTRS